MTHRQYCVLNILTMLTLAVGAMGCAPAEHEDIGSPSEPLLIRCPGPAVSFKANPQPDECQSPTLASANKFNFYFAAEDVADQDLVVYFFDAASANFLSPVLTLPNAVSFHTEFNATAITRAYYASATGATQEITVPANMVGVHHASTNHTSPSARWSNAAGQTEAISIPPMHTCTYLRTR